MESLVSTEALSALIAKPTSSSRLVILDATTTLPGERFDPDEAFREAHIPGARRFDLDLFSDPDTSLPHMVPSQGRFRRLIAELGVSNDSEIVFYDQTGIASAARGWWLVGLFGHDRVRVLDGGLPAWRAEGRATESGVPAPALVGSFQPSLRARRLVGLGDMIALSRDAVAGGAGAPRLLDARGAGRFTGETPEPRQGLASGHVPGAISLPFGELLDGTRLRPVDQLRQRLGAAGITQDSVEKGGPIVTSCGSGLTASVLSLALVVAGYGHHALFDGSWTEWAQAPVPRVLGSAALGSVA